MAVKDAKTAGSTFLAEVLAKLPAELQAKAKEAFEDAAAASALEVIGQGVLRQSDYSRQANELQTKETELETWRGQLNEWFTGRKADLEELETLRKTRGTQPPADPNLKPAVPAVDTSKFISKEDFDKTLADTERGAVGFFSALNKLSIAHFQQFGEVLDTDTLLQDKRLPTLGLDAVYKLVHKDQLDAKAAEAAAKAEQAIREDERKKLQAAQVHHPYPVRGNEPSTLSMLEAAATDKPVPRSIDDMAAEYARLAGTRG